MGDVQSSFDMALADGEAFEGEQVRVHVRSGSMAGVYSVVSVETDAHGAVILEAE